MTKKDYILLARVFKMNYEILQQQGHKMMLWLIVKDLCKELQHDNPRFDQDKFIKACGMA
jgi:hypothetical protein